MFQAKGKIPQISLKKMQPGEESVSWIKPSSGNRENKIVFLTGTSSCVALGRLLRTDFSCGVYD